MERTYIANIYTEIFCHVVIKKTNKNDKKGIVHKAKSNYCHLKNKLSFVMK